MPPKKQHTLARGHPWDLRQKRKRKSKHLDSIRAKPPLVLKPCKSEVQTFLDVREVEEQLAARVGSFACVTRPVLIMPGFVATHDNRRGRLRKVLQLVLIFACSAQPVPQAQQGGAFEARSSMFMSFDCDKSTCECGCTWPRMRRCIRAIMTSGMLIPRCEYELK